MNGPTLSELSHKACTKCGITKPYTSEYFHRSKAYSSGLSARCKECRKRPPKESNIRDGCKPCSKCGANLPATSEYFAWRKVNKLLRAECRECHKAYARDYSKRPHVVQKRKQFMEGYRDRNNELLRLRRALNPEHFRAYQKKINAQPKWREYRRAYAKAYHQRPEIKEKERKRMQLRRLDPTVGEKERLYRQSEKGKASQKARKIRRRIRTLAVEGVITTLDIRQQYHLQKGKCWWCSKDVGNDFHVDHRIPLSKGGTNKPDNICITCEWCNLSKGSKMPWEWNGRLL